MSSDPLISNRPLRVFNESGVLLADASQQPAIYEYLTQHHRRAKVAMISRLSRPVPRGPRTARMNGNPNLAL